MDSNYASRIESELEVKAYLQNLKYAIKHKARINFQAQRYVDTMKDTTHTNQYAANALFPNKNPVKALPIELLKLTTQDYIQTVKDIRFPERSEMREFGVVYPAFGDVYIKIRVELFTSGGYDNIFVMSFHLAETPFTDVTFPYKK